MPSDELDILLQSLNEATEETESTQKNEHKIKTVFIGIGKILASAINQSTRPNIEENYDKLLTYYSSIDTDYPHFAVNTWSNIDKPMKTAMTKNSNMIFDMVIEEIDDDMVSTDKTREFDPTEALERSIGRAAVYCKLIPRETRMTAGEFKSLFHEKLFGKKEYKVLDSHTIRGNYIMAESCIKCIKNRLLLVERVKMLRTKSKLINIIKDSRCVIGPIYIDLVENAMKTSIELFKFMNDEFEAYQSSIIGAVGSIVRKYKTIYSTSAIRENFTADVASIIYPINKSLNEAADAEYISDSFSENFANQISQLVESDRKKMDDVRQMFLKQMGTVLNSIPSDADLSKTSIVTYSNINLPIFNLIETFKNKFADNILYLDNYTEHYNEINSDIIDQLRRFLPESFNECIPTEPFDMSKLLGNIFKQICGTETSIEPNINVIGENIISIPMFLTDIDNHIEKIVSLTIKLNNKIVSSEAGNPLAITSIKNTFISYLAVILSIYKILSIFEKSAIKSVMAISDRLVDDEN